MNAHSSSSSGPGLLRIASGIATLPMSCSSAAWRDVRRAPRRRGPSRAPTAPASSATPSRCVAEVRVALGERLQQHVACSGGRRSARPRCLCAYMRWSASRSASARSRPRAGAATVPYARRDRRSPRRARRAPRRRRARRARGASRVGDEHAELVAAQPVGARRAPRPPRQRGRPSRISSASPAGWPKRVVVALEAVEVEQRERRSGARRSRRGRGARGRRAAGAGCRARSARRCRPASRSSRRAARSESAPRRAGASAATSAPSGTGAQAVERALGAAARSRGDDDPVVRVARRSRDAAVGACGGRRR